MLGLLCEAAGDRYWIDCRQVEAVIPQMQLRRLAGGAAGGMGRSAMAQRGSIAAGAMVEGGMVEGGMVEGAMVEGAIAGVLTYRDGVMTVLDLGQLCHQRPCRPRMSTRILVLQGRQPHLAHNLRVGLMAERVIDTRPLEAFERVASSTTDGLGSDESGADGFVGTDEMEIAGVGTAGAMLLDEQGIVQVLDVEPLIQQVRLQLRQAPFEPSLDHPRSQSMISGQLPESGWDSGSKAT